MTSPRTMLGPLTTVWTAPPLCSYAVALCDTCTTVWQGQTCNPSSNAHDYTDCWPPRVGDQSHYDPGVMMGWGLYSPGISCPAGYTSAAMATAGGNSGWGIEYSMLAGETAAACCPPGFAVSHIEAANTYAQTCVLTARSTSFLTVQCSSGQFVEFSQVTIPNTVSDIVLSSYVLFAPLYQLNFKASDLPAVSTTSSTSQSTSSSSSAQSLPTSSLASSTGGSSSSTTASPTSSTTTSSGTGVISPTTSSAPSPSPTDDPTGGLGTGAKVGLAIGAAMAAFILAMLAYYLVRRRRQRRIAAGNEGIVADGTLRDSKSGFLGLGSTRKHRSIEPELGGEEVRELDGKAIVSELPTRLPSSRVPPSQGPVFRRSDQTWVVTPTEGTFSTLDGRIVSPVDANDAVYELQGDETPRQTFESRRT